MYNTVYYIITVNNEGNKKRKKKLEREREKNREKISFSFQISYLLEQHLKYNRYEQTNDGNLQQ